MEQSADWKYQGGSSVLVQIRYSKNSRIFVMQETKAICSKLFRDRGLKQVNSVIRFGTVIYKRYLYDSLLQPGNPAPFYLAVSEQLCMYVCILYKYK